MKLFYKAIVSVIVIVALVIMYRSKFTSRSEQPQAHDFLLVGTNAEFAPFTFVDNGTIVGFDIDIANEVAQRLNKKLALKDMPFETLLPELQLGKIHMIAAGMTPTQERAEKVLFTQPYLEGDFLVVVTLRKNQIKDLEELNGKSVAVNDGYTADFYMSARQGPELIRLPSPAEALLALRNENVYAYVSAYTPIKSMLAKNEFEVELFPIQGTQESTALAISKEYSDLLPLIDQALDDMKNDGTINKLKAKWGLT